MAVTIKDIAERVGISNQAVSAVLNGKSNCRVSAPRREAILAAAELMGYVRNSLACSVASGKSSVVAIVVTGDLNLEYLQLILSGALQEADKHGFSVKLFNPRADELERTVRRLREDRVAGCLLHDAAFGVLLPWLRFLHKVGIPCGTFNLANPSGVGCGVATDDAEGMARAVHFLAGLGHRRIAHFSVCDQPSEYITARRDGYCAGMCQAAPGFERVIEGVSLGFKSNLDMLRNLLLEPEESRPSALLCATDFLAQEVFQAAYSLDMRIPERLSLIGFGGLSITRYSPVPLATLVQPFREMGIRAMGKLLDAVENQCNIDGVNILLPVTLSAAESCAPIKVF